MSKELFNKRINSISLRRILSNMLIKVFDFVVYVCVELKTRENGFVNWANYVSFISVVTSQTYLILSPQHVFVSIPPNI